jgi:hypothetical protein
MIQRTDLVFEQNRGAVLDASLGFAEPLQSVDHTVATRITSTANPHPVKRPRISLMYAIIRTTTIFYY